MGLPSGGLLHDVAKAEPLMHFGEGACFVVFFSPLQRPPVFYVITYFFPPYNS